MIGVGLKGVASLFPKNTIVNKLANSPTSIRATDVKKAIADVKGSVSGTRGIIGDKSPSINLLGSLGVKSTPKPTLEQGGVSTLQPSTNAVASALASQKSVTQSLTAGAMGVSAPTSPNYATDFETAKASDNAGIKASGTLEINPWLIGGVVGVIILANRKKRY